MGPQLSKAFIYVTFITTLQQVTSRHCNLRDVFITPDDKRMKHLDSLEILERCDFPQEEVVKRNDLESGRAIANAQILLQVPKEHKDHHQHHYTQPIYPYLHQHHHQHQHPSPKAFLPYMPHYAHIHSSYHSYIFPHVHTENCYENRTNDIEKEEKNGEEKRAEKKSEEKGQKKGEEKSEKKSENHEENVINSKDDVPLIKSRTKPLSIKQNDMITINLLLKPDGVKIEEENLLALGNRNNFEACDNKVANENKTLSKYFVPLPLKPLMEKALEKHIRPDGKELGKVQVLKVNIPKDKTKEAVIEIESIKDIDVGKREKLACECEDGHSSEENRYEYLDGHNSEASGHQTGLKDDRRKGNVHAYDKDENRQDLKYTTNFNEEDPRDDAHQFLDSDLPYFWRDVADTAKLHTHFSRFPLPNAHCPARRNSSSISGNEHLRASDSFNCPSNKAIVDDISWVDVNPSNTRENLRFSAKTDDETYAKYANTINTNVPYIHLKPLPEIMATLAEQTNNSPVNSYEEVDEEFPDYVKKHYVDVNNDTSYAKAIPIRNQIANARPSFARKLHFDVNGDRQEVNIDLLSHEKKISNPTRHIKEEKTASLTTQHETNREESANPREPLKNDYLKERYEEVKNVRFDALPIYNPTHNSRSPYARKRDRLTNIKKNLAGQHEEIKSSSLEDDKIYFEDDSMIPCTKRSNCRCVECAQYSRELNE